MRTNCPRCHSTDITRIPRCGFDHVLAFFGHWPYHCRRCSKCFHSGERHAPPEPSRKTEPRRRAAYEAGSAGPGIAYRTDPVRPTAKIVLQAETQAQMDEILLALNRAVQQYSQPVRPHSHTVAR